MSHLTDVAIRSQNVSSRTSCIPHVQVLAQIGICLNTSEQPEERVQLMTSKCDISWLAGWNPQVAPSTH
jgi:hypothetical protein